MLALAYDENAFHARALGGRPGAPNGFGFLVPRGERPRILGALWDSSVFPGERAPSGKILLRVMIGGALDPEAVSFRSTSRMCARQQTDEPRSPMK